MNALPACGAAVTNAAAAGNAGNIDWGACLLLMMPLLLAIWVLSPGAGLRRPLPVRAGGILLIIAGLVLCVAAVR